MGRWLYSREVPITVLPGFPGLRRDSAQAVEDDWRALRLHARDSNHAIPEFFPNDTKYA